MKRTRYGRAVASTAVALVAGIGFSPAAHGQVIVSADPGKSTSAPNSPGKPTRVEMTVSPAGTPKRTDRASLSFAGREVLDENAAVFYLQGLQLLGPLKVEEAEEISNLRDDAGLLANQDRADYLINQHLQDAVRVLELGARCRRCDWQTPIAEFGESALMPELGRFRAVARTLALKIRLAGARGNFDEAVSTLRIGIGFARHIADGPTLIQGLVGCAIADLMFLEMEEVVRKPGAPSLYWTLSSLGTPLFDVHATLANERRFVEFSFPELADIDSGRLGPEESLRAWKAFVKKIEPLRGGGAGGRSEGVADFTTAMSEVSNAIEVYPAACEYLLAAGYTLTEVNAMPMSYASLRYRLGQYLDAQDELHRWTTVPYWQAVLRLVALETAASELPSSRRIEALEMFSSPLARALSSHIRSERRLALLKCVEAIRLYAGVNAGKLPTRLSDTLSIAPCPLDPATGAAFDYRVEGGTAIISGASDPKWQSIVGFEYVVRVSSPGK